MVDFGIEICINLPYEEALESVSSALKEEGFGVLTKIDVKETLKNKLNKDFHQYAILGACNPPLAHKALSSVPEIGLLLPCNITVEATKDGKSIVRILDPKIMINYGDLSTNEDLADVATEAHTRLSRVARALQSSAT